MPICPYKIILSNALECVSLVSTRGVSNVTREIVASARMRLTNQLLSMLVWALNTREMSLAYMNCGMPLESPLFNLRDRCTCATSTFKPTQIGLLLLQRAGAMGPVAGRTLYGYGSGSHVLFYM